MKKNENCYDFSLTGFVIGIAIVAAIVIPTFTLFSAGVQTAYNITGNDTFSKYDKTSELITLTQSINTSVNERPRDTGTSLIDYVNGIAGIAVGALKVGYLSFNIFFDMVIASAQDIPVIGYYINGVSIIILIALSIGVLVSAFLRYRV